RHVDGIRLLEPNVAIDAGALVEPSFAPGGIDAHDEHVRSAVGDEIRDVEPKRGIAAHVAAQQVAVEGDEAVAEDAVELDCDASAGVGRGDLEGTAIPADARGRIVAAERFAAVV